MKGVPCLRSIRIHHRQCRRHLHIALMVVGNDDIDPELIGKTDLTVRRGSAIGGHQ